MAVSGMLLLIAAANLAGVLMARGVTRRGELAVRLTLGAGRWRLTRQLVTESLLLSTAGGALGLLVARWLVDLLIVGTPSRFVRWQIAVMSLDVPLDWRVLLVAAVSCLATGVLLGLVPARQAMRTDLLSGLAGESAGATRVVRGALRHWIVIPQVCLSLVLLMIAGTMTRALIRSEMVDPGYDADSVVLLDAQMPQQPYAPWTPDRGRQLRAERNAFGRRLLDQAGTAPGITAVTLSMTTPLMTVPLPSTNAWVAPREGFKPDGRHYWTAVMPVSDGYFATLDIRLLRGRTFDERDRADGARSAIVSEDLARWMWPDRDPVGQYLGRHFPDSPHPPHWMEVVGVVRNVHAPLSDGTWSPTVYEPLEQSELQLGVTLAARGESTPAELLQSLRQAVAEVDAQAVTSNPRTMREGIGEMLYPRRLAAAVLGASGAIGLLLASMGLYGVVSYSVAQRVREIGVRMALGADRDDIVRLIVREGARVAAAGIALGLMLAYAAIRLASRVVVELPSLDVATLLAVPALLSAVVVLACYLPALRAARVDPMVVLRTL
jgi:predicted permease